MNGDSVCFSRKSDEWETPQDLYDRLNKEFYFLLDAAATEGNKKCFYFLTQEQDALRADWKKIVGDQAVWLNPPYSQIGPFMQKAYEESLKGCTVVCLIPARTDTRYWHKYVMRAGEVRLIKGRLRFGGAKAGAPFPSCIVVFTPGTLIRQRSSPVFSQMEARA